jgi:NAD dependent epimerase/dehydratase family enzyme
MLAAMEERLLHAQTQLGNLEQQREAAQQEVRKPFPQEEELREKSARLAELDAQLNLGGERVAEQGKDKQEREVSDSTGERQGSRPSVLAGLKKSAAEIQADKKPHQRHEREER